MKVHGTYYFLNVNQPRIIKQHSSRFQPQQKHKPSKTPQCLPLKCQPNNLPVQLIQDMLEHLTVLHHLTFAYRGIHVTSSYSCKINLLRL